MIRFICRPSGKGAGSRNRNQSTPLRRWRKSAGSPWHYWACPRPPRPRPLQSWRACAAATSSAASASCTCTTPCHRAAASRRARRCCASRTSPAPAARSRPFMALAGRDRSVYAPDLPGLGESDPPGPQATVADYAAALGDFLDTMRIRQAARAGQPRRRTDRGGTGAGPARADRRARHGVGTAGRCRRSGANSSSRRPRATPSASSPRRSTQYPARERLARLTQKVLVVRPKDDLWEASWGMREVLPSARVVDLEIPGGQLFAGHAGAPVRGGSRLPARLATDFRDSFHIFTGRGGGARHPGDTLFRR